jgi:DNA-binding transcriptional LysR family regulator
VRLLVRSRAGMALTEPGQSLAYRMPGLLDWDDGVREIRRAASHPDS